MLRASLRSLAVAALSCIGLAASAEAVTPINTCRELNKPGETYVLTTDITTNSSSSCLFVQGDRITIDLAGHSLTGPASSAAADGISVAFSASVVVKNGALAGFANGIQVQFSPRITIRNVAVTNNRTGIAIINNSPNSLVKDCTASGNGIGVVVEGVAQVEGCVMEGNTTEGIWGPLSSRGLFTRNIVRGTEGHGIRVGSFSTVTYNTVNGNAKNGIIVGVQSLVTGNTANENDVNGIQADCPSTITNNEALQNGGQNIATVGVGCFVKGNVTGVNPP